MKIEQPSPSCRHKVTFDVTPAFHRTVCSVSLMVLWAMVSSRAAKSSHENSNEHKVAIEKAVAELVEVRDITGGVRVLGERDPYLWKVILFGFEAVPSLIEHLDDHRLSNAEVPFFNNFSGYQLEVRHVASEILERIAGQVLARNALERQRGVVLDKSAVAAWFKKARVVGEERYFVTHVLEDKKWPNDVMLAVIAKKYPQRLADVYRRLVDERPEMVSWYVTAAITASSLSLKSKRELMLYGLMNKDLTQRIDALRELAKLDRELFERRLVDELKSLPTSSRYPYRDCPQVRIPYLVRQTKNPTVWKVFKQAAERVDVGIRMEFLKSMYPFEADDKDGLPLIKHRTFKEQLAFLSDFLTDSTVADVSTAPALYGGPYTLRGKETVDDDPPRFDRIEVRNYAANCIAHALAIERNPSPAWTEKEWARFRREMPLDWTGGERNTDRADIRRRLNSLVSVRIRTADDEEAEDTGRAHEIMCTLAFRSSSVVVVHEIEQDIRAVRGTNETAIRKACLKLGSKDFKVRRQAESDLRELNVLAVPYLKDKLKETASLEQSRRLEAVLRNAQRPTSGFLRIYRLIAILEYVGSDDALAVLRYISRRQDIRVFGSYAKECIERLKR